MITIASLFSGEDNLFCNILDHKFQIRQNKRMYHPSSDHIAIAWIFKQWVNFNETTPHLTRKFCKDMMIRPIRIQILNRKYKVYKKIIVELLVCTH